MKKLSFLALAAAGLLLGACSSKDVAEDNAPDLLSLRSGSYISVGINLPDASQNTTRGWSETDTDTSDPHNPILDSGLPVEYGVKNAILLFFAGTNEAGAKLAQVEVLNPNFGSVADDPDQITTNGRYAVLLTSKADYVGALAVLNGTNVITRVSDTQVQLNNGKVLDEPTVSELQNEISAANADGSTKFINKIDGTNYFFMTNAVLSKNRGGYFDPTASPDIHVLAEVNRSITYETPEEAIKEGAAASADIYVERGVAKVTVMTDAANFLTIGSGLKKGDKPYELKGEFLGWTLDNTNKKSFFVRNVSMPEADFKWNIFNSSSEDDKYRFIGTSSVDKFYNSGTDEEKAAKTWYRTYWCIDPNYNTTYTDTQLNDEFYVPGKKTLSTATGKENPQYCYENTFDVAHQSFKNTTRAIIGVTLNGNKTFYTFNDDQRTLYGEDDVPALIKGYLMSITAFSAWYNTEGNGSVLDPDNVVVTFGAPDAKGVVKVADVTIKKANLKASYTDDVKLSTTLPAVLTDLEKYAKNIKQYVDGKTYYVIRIKHFGDVLTPWGKGAAEAGITDIYPGLSAAEYLGRYGMVRNNWYYLEIGKILKIGHPAIPNINSTNPDDPGTPDDPDDPDHPDHPDDTLDDVYIQARINILSWAKRPQSWNLK